MFCSGTPVSSSVNELAICFNLLTRNDKLFPIAQFETMFITKNETLSKAYIMHKEIIIKRIAGLVSTVNIDLEQASNFPTLR